MRFLRSRNTFLIAGFVLLITISSFGQAAPDPWLIMLQGETGSINSHTNRKDLIRRYGKANVVDKEVDVGEGETAPGTVIFPNEPERSLDIQWKNPSAMDAPSFVTVHGKATHWKTVHGIRLGTSLKELEGINSRPFHLSGFGWDYSGTVMSWEGGVLEQEFQGHGRVLLRLDYSENTRVPQEEQNEVTGDRDFSSNHPVMQKLNPTVYEMLWVFP